MPQSLWLFDLLLTRLAHGQQIFIEVLAGGQLVDYAAGKAMLRKHFLHFCRLKIPAASLSWHK